MRQISLCQDSESFPFFETMFFLSIVPSVNTKQKGEPIKRSQQVRKRHSHSAQNVYEDFREAYIAENCYCVFILTSPVETVYIGYCQGNLINRWQNGKVYRKSKDLSVNIKSFGWDNYQKEIYREEPNIDEAREL